MFKPLYGIRHLLVLLISFLMIDALAKEPAASERTKVSIETSVGNMVIELFNETPVHRDNFMKLVKEGYYDGLLFHRIIADFMVQGGDPNSKNAAAGERLGQGGPGYTLPAEIIPNLIHQKGALAAARLGDQQNPEKRSSGSQFYIVDGRPISSTDLKLQIESKRNRYYQIKGQAFFKDPANQDAMTAYKTALQQKNQKVLKSTEAAIHKWVDDLFGPPVISEYTAEQMAIYSTNGGAPHLDGEYTVFGQVVEGMDIIDKLAAVEKDGTDRPITNITMKMRILE